MEPLSGLDASFLYLEHQSQPLHVCALFVLDVAGLPGGYDFGRFRAALGEGDPAHATSLTSEALVPTTPR